MRGEIICIGDELINGRVAETNSRYAASRLWPLGISVDWVVMVGDDPQAIKEALAQALSRADFVLVSGGLGATDDDLTAATAAEVFGLPLAESKRMIKNLRAFWSERGSALPSEARKMAWLPQGAKILCSTCAGFSLQAPGGQPVYFLPGVPEEMRYITDTTIVPELLSLSGDNDAVAFRELSVFGLGETEVNTRLQDLELAGARIGYYPRFPLISLTISARDSSPDQAQERVSSLVDQIRSRLGDYIVAADGQTLEEEVAQAMIAQGLTLALAESCTGGLIGHRLTQVSGSSAFFERGLVVYSNRAKQELLGVRPEVLQAHGAVSSQTAAEMALGAARNSGADLGLAVTGIAGPTGGTPAKPVGTVFFGLAREEKVRTGGYLFHGSRSQIKAQAAETALDWLRRYLNDHAYLHST
ncbi:MAG: competence/damage-inducible protein A [Desulfarculaceae bacterium]|jgi:nicotinamide-nucleotide amidase